MMSRPAVEPVPPALIYAQQESYGRNSRGFHHNRLEEHEDVIAIGGDFVRRVARCRGFFRHLVLGVLFFVPTYAVAFRFIDSGFRSPFRDLCGGFLE